MLSIKSPMQKVVIRKQSGAYDRRGVAAVELAIVLPLLLVLAIVSFEIGRIYIVVAKLENAMRLVAERGATSGRGDRSGSSAEVRLESELQQLLSTEVAEVQVDVTLVPVSGNNYLHDVQVVTECDLTPILTYGGLLNRIHIQRKLVYRRFR